MWTGQQTLQSINKTLAEVNQDIRSLDASLHQLSDRLTENKREQLKLCESLAQLQLNELQQQPEQHNLSTAEAQVISDLEHRRQLLLDLDQEIANQEQQLEQLSQQRQQQVAALEEQNKELLDVELKAQQALATHSQYQEKLKQAQEADAVADRAEDKLKQANQDRIEKGKPFEKDSLFMYLWHRHYEQPAYQANPLIRALDRWVAKLCKYSQARANYWLLLELPERLAAHAESVRQKAEVEVDKLKHLEQSLAAEYQVPEHQQQLHVEQEKLDKLDEQETQLDYQLTAKKMQFSSGKDPAYQQVLHRLSQAVQRQNIYELKHLSNRTMALEDDHLVSLFADLKDEENDLQEDITANRRRQNTHLQRLQELKQLKQKFKHQRYDDFRSGFDNEGLISSALNEFLKGMLNSGDLWRTIERSQRHRNVGARPDFGSGGLGRSPRKNTWHWPGRKGGQGGFRLPRSNGSSSRNSGGFRTGGGF